MPEHLLDECDQKANYVSCDVTGEDDHSTLYCTALRSICTVLHCVLQFCTADPEEILISMWMSICRTATSELSSSLLLIAPFLLYWLLSPHCVHACGYPFFLLFSLTHKQQLHSLFHSISLSIRLPSVIPPLTFHLSSLPPLLFLPEHCRLSY